MKKLLLLMCFSLTAIALFGQSNSLRAGNCKTKSNFCPKWSLFHETTYNFKQFGINSVNADVIVICNRYYMASIRFGINYLTFPKISSVGVPLEFNFMMGRGAWLFETGLGLDYLFVYKNYSSTNIPAEDNIPYLAATGRIGLRYEKLSGIFFRLGYNPHISLQNQDKIEVVNRTYINMLSLGIGYTFNN